ncbi:MAG: hypothetical protein ACJ8E7_04975, partial [Sphingomicrobium sp.]
MTAATETDSAAKPVSPNPSGWRPSAPSADKGEMAATTTGNRALMLEEPLLFEIGKRDQTGVDFDYLSSPAKAGAQSGEAAD